MEEVQLAVSVSVTKPEHKGTGRGKVTDYLVTTVFPQNVESLVRRTFEDFEWIQNRLIEERMGIIVPALPKGRPANQKRMALFEEDFVQKRQIALDRFMQRIMGQSDLADAPSLLVFLTASPTDWTTAKKNTPTQEEIEASNHKSATGSEEGDDTVIINAEEPVQQRKRGWLGRVVAAKKDQWALRKKNLILEETPVEAKKFQDIAEYADHLETCVRILAEDSEQLVAAYTTQAEKYQTMGAAFCQLWGEHELSNTSSSNMYQIVGECWTTMCSKLTHQFDFGQNLLQTPLEELVLDVQALKDSLHKRKHLVYSYTKKVQEGRRLQQQMDKLKATADLSAHQDQYFNLERAIRVSDVEVAEAKRMKELVTERLEQDIDRFRAEWHERMRFVLEKYHDAKIKSLHDQAKQLLKVMPALSEIDSGRSNIPTSRKKDDNTLQISYTSMGATASFTNASSQGSPPGVPPPSSFAALSLDEEEDVTVQSSMISVGLEEVDEATANAALVAPPPAAAPPPPPTQDPPTPPKSPQEENAATATEEAVTTCATETETEPSPAPVVTSV